MSAVDAVVVGAGPNGLAAAITLAAAGRSVRVIEAGDTPGGGARTAELTLPGFRHDVCSAVHPLAAGSPWFASLGLERYGLQWSHPEVALAHPLDGGRAGVLWRDVDRTAAGLGTDGPAWHRHIGTHAARWERLAPMLLGSLLRPPRHPIDLARFGIPALLPATLAGRRWFEGDEARALFAGCAAHSLVSLARPLTTSFGLVLLASAHSVGWPIAVGGSQAIASALVAHLESLGGTVETGRRVTDIEELPPARAVLFDTPPAEVVRVAGRRLSGHDLRRFRRFRHGPAAFKVDYALDGPVPWHNEQVRRAGTVHVAGTFEEIAASEAAVAAGRVPDRPFVLVAQQSLFDPSRAPTGKHTLWAYCHVPNGCEVDMSDAIERQIERFAPGFRDLVLARHVASPAWLEQHNPNYVGGDIAGGSNDGLRAVFRPSLALRPYRTADPSVWLCSASTPPGGGVHGMCGVHAANAALRGPLR